MKTRILTLLLLFVSLGLWAQTRLSFSDHSLRNCDSNTYREIQFPDPGTSGPNQTWDFSHLQFTGKNIGSALLPASSPKMPGSGDYNLMLDENGYSYILNATESVLEELGYENREQKLSLLYSDPVLKMKYPFAYGDHFTDHFAGVALYSGTGKIDFTGDHDVSADGFGTLVLPDRVINGALRVKSVKKGIQINQCGTTDVSIVKYSWYATGYRYPLMNLNVVETSANGGTPVVTKTAYANTDQLYQKSGLLGTYAQVPAAQVDNTGIKVVISPNPFTDQLTFSYLLPAPAAVSIDLFDMAGKTIGWLTKNQLQSAGIQNGTLNAAQFGLKPGVCFMRFAFGNQTVICKIVKL